MPAGAVLRCYAAAVRELRATGVSNGLADAAEAMARHRLEHERLGG